MFTRKEEVVAYYKEKLLNDDRWAVRALEVIYNYQVESEKAEKQTKLHNGVGFTALDAPRLTEIYKSYKETNIMNPYDLQYLRWTMPKYAKQLVAHSMKIGKLVKEKKEYKFV